MTKQNVNLSLFFMLFLLFIDKYIYILMKTSNLFFWLIINVMFN